MTDRVGVLLPMPLGPLDYAVPEGVELAEGDFVVVELGTRPVVGVVWGPGDGAVPAARLKPAGPRLDVSADARRDAGASSTGRRPTR